MPASLGDDPVIIIDFFELQAPSSRYAPGRA
jgi:hypothetical protein